MNLFSFLENTRKTAQAKDFSPSISRLRKKKRREKRKERENIVLYFRLGKGTEKKKKRRKGREKGKRKNGKGGADWLLSGGPIGKGAEQREDKRICPVDDKEECLVTGIILTGF